MNINRTTIALITIISLLPTITLCSSTTDKKVKIEPQYTLGKAVGTINSSTLDEISGVATSSIYTDCLWVHNDSADEPNIYLINLQGELITTLSMPSITNRDWESIAIADGYIYIGETGDNWATYDDKKIYRIAEPTTINTLKRDQHMTIGNVETMRLNFSNGQRDCETMMYDPWSDELILVSKREDKVMSYATPFIATSNDQIIEVDPIATLTFSSATAGDISLSGKEILIKNYMSIFLYNRQRGESIVDALSKAPTKLAYSPEPQGEAIAWSTHEDAFYTISEKAGTDMPIIYRYEAK